GSKGLKRRFTGGTIDFFRDHHPKEDFVIPSTIQAHFGENTYPVDRFVLDQTRALEIGRTELVRQLYYPDISKKHNALTDLLITDSPPPLIAKHLADALNIN